MRAERTIPRATILGTLLATAIYIVATVAITGVVPQARLVESTSPLAGAARAEKAIALTATTGGRPLDRGGRRRDGRACGGARRGLREAVVSRRRDDRSGCMGERIVTIRCRAAVAALVLVLGAPPAAAADREWEATAVRRGSIADDLYVAGREVDIDADVNGDVVVAGGRVTVGRVVSGDVNAAGGTVRLVGRLADDVRAAGGEVTVEAEVADDLVAAGGRVRLAPGASVAGRVRVAGGEVDLAGRVGGNVLAAAGTLRIGGEVAGDVRAAAREVVVLPGARIAGGLEYWSGRAATIDPSARVEGPVTHHPVEVGGRAARAARRAATVAGVLFFVGLLAAGTVLYLLLPDFTAAAAATVGTDPWKSLGLGFALLVAAPVAVALLLVTVIGVPLGLALLALYLVLLLVGFLVTAFFLGDLGGRAFHRRTPPSRRVRVLLFLAALVVLWLVRLVPVVGGWVLFVALLLGVGAWTVQAYRTYTGYREAPRHA